MDTARATMDAEVEEMAAVLNVVMRSKECCGRRFTYISLEG